MNNTSYQYPRSASDKLNSTTTSSSPKSIRDRCIPNMHPQSINASRISILPPIDRYYPEQGSATNGNKSKIKQESDTTSTTTSIENTNINPNKDIITQQQRAVNNEMMLPPPPRFPFSTSSNNQNFAVPQVEHLEWLKAMNERAAKQSTVPTTTNTNLAPPLIAAPIALPPQLPQPISTSPYTTANSAMQQQNPPPILQPATNINYNPLSQTQNNPIINTTATTNTTNITNKNETEERRLRRLSRNRESARQSRRRKKELLETLSNKVNDVYKKLEDERKNQINSMIHDLQSLRYNNIKRLHSLIVNDNKSSSSSKSKKDEDVLYQSLTQHSQQGNNKNQYDIKKEITLYQYEKLKTLVLPTSSQYILWLLYSNPISFFQNAKELAIKQNNLMNSTRISSKQIGEKYQMQQQQEQQDNTYECENNNFKLFWPYFCNELSISVDQEERIVSLYKIIQKSLDKSNLERINKTQHVIYYLKRIMLQKLQQEKQQQQQEQQQKNNISNILTKDQYIKYLKWRIDNKSKCNDIIQKMMLKKQVVDEEDSFKASSSSSSVVSSSTVENKSLDELCRRLNEALNVSTSSNKIDEATNNMPV